MSLHPVVLGLRLKGDKVHAPLPKIHHEIFVIIVALLISNAKICTILFPLCLILSPFVFRIVFPSILPAVVSGIEPVPVSVPNLDIVTCMSKKMTT